MADVRSDCADIRTRSKKRKLSSYEKELQYVDQEKQVALFLENTSAGRRIPESPPQLQPYQQLISPKHKYFNDEVKTYKTFDRFEFGSNPTHESRKRDEAERLEVKIRHKSKPPSTREHRDIFELSQFAEQFPHENENVKRNSKYSSRSLSPYRLHDDKEFSVTSKRVSDILPTLNSSTGSNTQGSKTGKENKSPQSKKCNSERLYSLSTDQPCDTVQEYSKTENQSNDGSATEEISGGGILSSDQESPSNGRGHKRFVKANGSGFKVTDNSFESDSEDKNKNKTTKRNLKSKTESPSVHTDAELTDADSETSRSEAEVKRKPVSKASSKVPNRKKQKNVKRNCQTKKALEIQDEKTLHSSEEFIDMSESAASLDSTISSDSVHKSIGNERTVTEVTPLRRTRKNTKNDLINQLSEVEDSHSRPSVNKKKLSRTPKQVSLSFSFKRNLGLKWDKSCTPPRRYSLRLVGKDSAKKTDSEAGTPRSRASYTRRSIADVIQRYTGSMKKQYESEPESDAIEWDITKNSKSSTKQRRKTNHGSIKRKLRKLDIDSDSSVDSVSTMSASTSTSVSKLRSRKSLNTLR